MNAAVLIRDIHAAGIRLSVAGDKLHVRAPRGAMTEALRQRLANHKAELLDALTTPHSPPHVTRQVIEYRIADNPDQWLIALGAGGNTYEQTVAAIRLTFGERLIETRPHHTRN